ncbi:MFS general substrate transporter [Choiromyces venosus 120613-1]|uniref:MFS general substrate transporter n=1 Tax=Choiromyces venosus 120613-1 TaxID=1336337 RepID=A0A3N4JU32_9PEZI|nr:MFS general substrate transporter [Choiromyces venosus 120613-1]
MSFTICLATRFGLGEHREDASGDLAAPQGKNPTLMATKTSMLVFYLGLSKNYKLLRIANWTTLAVVNVAGLILTSLIAFQCNPVSATFQSSLPPSFKCMSTYTILYASGPVNLITDLAILILPMPILTSLRLPRKQKIILIMLFAAGGFVTIIGIVRIHYFEKAVSTGLLNWDGSLSFMWTSIEVNVGIFCASIPMIKPLVARLFPSCIGVTGDASPTTDLTESSGTIPSLSADNRPPGFFDLKRPKSALALDMRESIRPVCQIAGLFFIWGFAYGFVDTLNKRFENLIDISTEQYIGLHAAYFAAYAIMPLFIGGPVLKRYGFKATIMTGLTIAGCGCLIFWPSAVLESYEGFCVSMFFVGTGLATIECAANLFMTLCGPAKYSEIRLNLVQGVQPVGIILASTFASKVLPTIYKNPEGSLAETSLVDIQWIYLAFGLFSFILAFAFYYADIPEVKDADFGPKQKGTDNVPKSLLRSEHGISFAWAFLAQLFYVGAQEVVMSFSIAYLGKAIFQSSPRIRTGQGLFIAGRFIAAASMFVVKPRWILLAALGGGGIFSVLAMTVSGGDAQLGMLLMVWLFMSSCFPTIFALSVRGLGVYSKDASKYQVSAVGAGAVFPGVYYAVLRDKGSSSWAARYAMCVPTALFAGAATYPLYLCMRPKERERLRRVENGAQALGLCKRGGSTVEGESEHIEMAGLC